MEQYDICFLTVAGDEAITRRLADNIRKYRLPSGVSMSGEEPGYQKVFVDVCTGPFDQTAAKRLDSSRFIAVMCSPDAKKSPEIADRLRYYRFLHQNENIIPVIVRGEPAEAFPDGFIERKLVKRIRPDMTVAERMETIEPVAADLRANDARHLEKLLQYESVRIIATVLGLHPDVLEQRHRTRENRRIMFIAGFAGTVCLVLSCIFLRLGYIAAREGNIAREQTQLSAELAQRTMSELPAAFEGDPEAMVYVEEAIAKAEEAIAALGLEDLIGIFSGDLSPGAGEGGR